MATKRFILSLLVMFLVGTTLVSAQKTRVTGEVTEAGMGPIAGVTVILQGSSTGTVTGFDGSVAIDPAGYTADIFGPGYLIGSTGTILYPA